MSTPLMDFVNNEFDKYKTETAFFFGNGINNYSKTTNSWRELLIDLAGKYVGKEGDYAEILAGRSVSYPEFFDIIRLASNKDRETATDLDAIKKGFKDSFGKWKPQPAHITWINKIQELDRPVLTTNYDCLFELSNEKIVNFIKGRQIDKNLFRPVHYSGVPVVSTYPWHSYYSHKDITNSNKEFAIWHIHGLNEYPLSIRLGLTDYIGMTENAREWLYRSEGNPFYKRDDIDNWVGKNSWLDVFIHNHLFIMGFNLDSQETALRWLLIVREMYYRWHPEIPRMKAWFVVSKEEDDIAAGKLLFFKQLNIQILEAESFEEIYETVPGRI